MADPNSITFGALALGGLGLVFSALRSLRQEIKTMVIESDDHRQSVRSIIAESSIVSDLKARVRVLEADRGMPGTTAIPRGEA